MNRATTAPSGAGRELLRRWRDRPEELPPAVRRLGITLTSQVDGPVGVRMPLVPELAHPDGRRSASAGAVLADFGLAVTVLASVPYHCTVTTLAMTFDHLAAHRARGGLYGVFTALPHDGEAVRHSVGEVVDDCGTTVSRVSGWLLLSEGARDGEAEPLAHEVAPPSPHVLDLLGATVGDDGSLQFRVRKALTNPVHTLHGGISALACEVAAETVLGGHMPLIRSAFTYHRPVLENSLAKVSAEVVRRGRRTSTVHVEVSVEGRLAVEATVVGVVRP